MKKGVFAGFFLAALLAAAVLRLTQLGARPMHHDEANQALKLGALLEHGEYRYDKNDHHGPSLYYLSLPFALAASGGALAGLSEAELRSVTAAFGIGTVLLLLLFLPLIGRGPVAASAILLALSPAMVYFSRFYIQETLLVFFLAGFLAFLWRYLHRPGWGWAAASGVFAGLMYATKETAAISFAAAAAALLLTFFIRRGQPDRPESAATGEHPRPDENRGEKSPRDQKKKEALGKSSGLPARLRWDHLLLALAAAAAVSFLLFSSFLKNSNGFKESILSFKVYFIRAGEAGFHVHPWFYYLQTLFLSRVKSGPLWSEALILVLALAGCVSAFRARPSSRPSARFGFFLAAFTILNTAAYSAIPYKTPWNALPFYLGFILLAGFGLDSALRACRVPFLRLLILLGLGIGLLHLGIQSFRACFRYPADPRNPHVYAQTSPDFLKLVKRIEEIASHQPEGRGLLIKVIAGPYEIWPLPWYLRAFSRVGYWTSAAEVGEIGRPPILITSAEEAVRLEDGLNTVYRSEYYELRPGVLLVLHVRDDIWEAAFAPED